MGTATGTSELSLTFNLLLFPICKSSSFHYSSASSTKSPLDSSSLTSSPSEDDEDDFIDECDDKSPSSG